MAKLIYGLNVSLDGYVDHQRFIPSAELYHHYIDHVRGLDGILYGRTTYDIMRYWDEDQPDWDAEEREFARVWCPKPKWVASRSLEAVGPNATLLAGDLVPAIRKLKADHSGNIGVGGTILAHALGEAGLIDEYRLYFHPVVLGSGKPFFAGPPPPLHLAATDRITSDVIRLTYVPA